MSVIFKGTPVCTGIQLGLIYIVKSQNYVLREDKILESDIDLQISKLETAFCKTFIEIDELHKSLDKILNENENQVLNCYTPIFEDTFFIKEVKNTIKTQKCPAENAVHFCFNKYIESLKHCKDDYFMQKCYDLNDIKCKIIKNLIEVDFLHIDDINSNHIVVINELFPSIATMLGNKNIKGIVASEGAGNLSHSSIILRGFGIPTLNKINFNEIQKYHGRNAIIDCFEGKLLIDLNVCDINSYNKKLIKNTAVTKISVSNGISTCDNYRIDILANISSLKEFDAALENNVSGIGLVRTETLFLELNEIPNENRQFDIYSKLVIEMNGKPIVIRTADIGSDKIPGIISEDYVSIPPNTRGLNRSLLQKDLLLTQLRAILRASLYGDVSITFPMVNNADEIIQVKNTIHQILNNFKKQNIFINSVKIGAVIETINAIDNLNDILKEVDFINIGTNDLIQQIKGWSRKFIYQNEIEYLNPEFLKTLKAIINITESQNKKISVCGEMASEPLGAIILIGMGINKLSMSPNKFSKLISYIKNINFIETKNFVNDIIKCESSEEINKLIDKWIDNRKCFQCLI